MFAAIALPFGTVRLAPTPAHRVRALCMQASGDPESARGTPLGDLAEKLSIGERIGQGTKNSWVNPAYWNRQFVTASHIANNVPNGSNVLELGKDAKNLYYLNEPSSVTLIVPPSNIVVQEGPIREAAAKLKVPFSLFTEKPLDTIPLIAGSFDAALIFDMLDGAPEQVRHCTLHARTTSPDDMYESGHKCRSGVDFTSLGFTTVMNGSCQDH
eukprot:scaffold27386_cov28-Tisochrysis_lutea.AAC.5